MALNLRKNFIQLLLVIAVTNIISSCNGNKVIDQAKSFVNIDKFSQEDFTLLSEQMANYDSIIFKSIKKDSTNVRIPALYDLKKFYEYNQHQSIWIKEDGSLEKAKKLIQEVKKIVEQEIPEQFIPLNTTQNILEEFERQGDWHINKVFSVDTALSHLYCITAQSLKYGVVDPNKLDSQWFQNNDTIVDFKFIDSDKDFFTLYRSQIPSYQLILNEITRLKNLNRDSIFLSLRKRVDSNAADEEKIQLMNILTNNFLIDNDTFSLEKKQIISFQKYFGLTTSGKIDENVNNFLSKNIDSTIIKYKINLERLRWMPQQLGSNYIFVTIPKMELVVIKDNQFYTERRVIVGKPARATPTISQNMSDILFNPPWGVPPTIAKNDVVPGIARSGGAYLAKKGLQAYDHKGNVVPASQINQSNYKRYTFRQAPGAGNSLGNVKFNMPNKEFIYLHDTPHRWDFKSVNRALSSGCVRVQDPLDLAYGILTDFENNNTYSREQIDSIVQTRKTKMVKIKNKLPVYIVYLTAFDVNNKNQHAALYKDIYKRDFRLITALKP